MFSLIFLSDKSWLIIKNIIILRILSILGGRVLSWLIFPFYSFIFLPFYLKYLTIFVCLIGILIGYLIFRINNFFLKYFIKVYLLKYFLSSIWFIPFFSTLRVISNSLKIGIIYSQFLDFGWLEYFGGKNIFNLLKFFRIKLNKFSENYFFIYLIFFFSCIIFFILI